MSRLVESGEHRCDRLFFINGGNVVDSWRKLDVSRRRDVQGLVAALGDLKSGMHVSATFKSDEYGICLIEGIAVLSVTGSYLVGGQPLDSGSRPGKPRQPVAALRALTLGITVRDAGNTAEVAGPITNDVMAHGDLVRATFEQSPYGIFEVTGIVVWAPVGNVFVVGGGSFLTRKSGEQAARLKGLAILARRGSHHLHVPSKLDTWPSSDDTEMI
ncbi:hypothetical protein ACFXPS_33465 [Nocardia sp. NPDC059091]|uniref:hypothetical protein n=1 Tax=unclassified Nocardia TaxID=2637762 RepID=UPI00369A8A93